MLKYIRADLYRIFQQIPRYILLVLFQGVCAAGLCIYGLSKQLNGLGITSQFTSMMVFIALAFGILELLAVFGDDFRAKTMQVAIGTGISRRHVMLAKLLEVTLLVLIDLLLCALLVIVACTAAGISFQGRQIVQCLVQALCGALSCVLATDFTMIILFFTQKTGLAPILFLLFYTDPVNWLMVALQSNEIVAKLRLPDYTFTSLIGTLNTQMGLGISFPLKEVLILCVYIAALFLIGSTIFSKQELDF